MLLATLCYVKRDACTLMVYRNKKPNDIHEGKWNGLGGKFEAGETPEECVQREVLEESAYRFVPRHLLGIYRWHSADSDTTYLRFAFTGEINGFDPDRSLDTGIIQALWLTSDEIRATQARHRSPLILRCVEDFLDNKRYPLDLLVHYE